MKKNNTAIIWFLIGSAFIFFSNGKWAIPVSIWIVLICFLRFSRLNKPWVGFLSIFSISFLSNVFIWKGLIPLPAPLYYIVSAITGIFFSLPFLIERLIDGKKASYIQTLVYPALFTFFSYLSSLISPSGTFGSIGFSQSNLILIQIVSLTGIWGIIFILGWTASTINYLIDNYRFKQKMNIALAVYLSIIGLVLVYGIFRIYNSNPKETIKIAGIINDHNFNKPVKENLDAFIKSSNDNAGLLFAETKSCVQNGAKVVFWQETALMVLDSLEGSLIQNAEIFTKENKIYLGMAVFSLPKDFPSKPAENKIIWITPQGKIGFEYLKSFPTPGEIVLKGDLQPKVIFAQSFNLSSVICFDMNFPGFIREFGRRNVDILCVPGHDWREITPYHTNITLFRGIENGFSIFRTTGNGLSAAFNSDGSLISKLNSFDSQEKIMYADVPIHRRFALYPIIGDFLPWVGILFVLIYTTVFVYSIKSPG
jgi:apolipoprotein N-acyltransferase